jgi:hypothetical protein
MVPHFSSHEHGVCSFIASALFGLALKLLLQFLLPIGSEWLAETIPAILVVMVAAHCPRRE